MDHSPISFRSAETAWFWTMRVMQTAPIQRSPESESVRQRMQDVIKCLDTLYRNRRIEMLHVRIIRLWGVRGVAPNPARPRERSDWRIWHEAMEQLEPPLRGRGIVVGSVFQDAAD